jgi:microcystin degradation protein MlrC
VRIAIAGIAHEALTFAPIQATLADFDVWCGDEVLEFPGVADAIAQLGFEPVPLLVAQTHTPGGPVELPTYLNLRRQMLEALRAVGEVDGVCLVLHGSMLVEQLGSGETDLAHEVRAVVGPDVLIAARLDLHAILTDEFARTVDVWAGYRTAPHRDAPETFQRAAARLVRAFDARQRPRPVFVRLPLLLPGENATTDNTGADHTASSLTNTGDRSRSTHQLLPENLSGPGGRLHAASPPGQASEQVHHASSARWRAQCYFLQRHDMACLAEDTHADAQRRSRHDAGKA